MVVGWNRRRPGALRPMEVGAVLMQHGLPGEPGYVEKVRTEVGPDQGMLSVGAVIVL